MDNLYRDFILEHYRSPHNKGVLDPHDLHFADSNPTCGDEMSMTLRLDEARNAIADVAFDGRGCAISQASASILTDELRGQTLDEVRAIDPKHVLDELVRPRSGSSPPGTSRRCGSPCTGAGASPTRTVRVRRWSW